MYLFCNFQVGINNSLITSDVGRINTWWEDMARIGRGRARGAQIFDLSDLNQGLGHGKIMAGRGTMSYRDTEFRPHIIVDAKVVLETELSDFESSGKGCFIHMALNYFKHSDDVQYFMEKVMDSILKSPIMVEQFAMSLRLIVSLKPHEEELKLKMFSKLQNTFNEMQLLMKDSDTMSQQERQRARNFCNLIGQIYFRFRVQVNSYERYRVLATPVVKCLQYLLSMQQKEELSTLIKLIILNYPSLYEHAPDAAKSLSANIHRLLVDGSEDRVCRLLLLCALDYTTSRRGLLPKHLQDYYEEELDEEQLEDDWRHIALISPVEMLVAIPSDVEVEQMDRFNISIAEYNKYRLVDL